MINGARWVVMPDGKRVLQLYSPDATGGTTGWWTPRTLDFEALERAEKEEVCDAGYCNRKLLKTPEERWEDFVLAARQEHEEKEFYRRQYAISHGYTFKPKPFQTPLRRK